MRPDFLFSFYFRQMMKPRVLALPARGALNLHGSLLPRYRGRAPVNWVLVHGESETGVTLHEMDEKPDHGDIVAQRRVAITRDDTALSLTRKLAAEGAAAAARGVPRAEGRHARRAARRTTAPRRTSAGAVRRTARSTGRGRPRRSATWCAR